MRENPSLVSLRPRVLMSVMAENRFLSWLHIPSKLDTCEKLHFSLPNTDKSELHKNLNINLPKMCISYPSDWPSPRPWFCHQINLRYQSP